LEPLDTLEPSQNPDKLFDGQTANRKTNPNWTPVAPIEPPLDKRFQRGFLYIDRPRVNARVFRELILRQAG
jgi:hypothetical protein